MEDNSPSSTLYQKRLLGTQVQTGPMKREPGPLYPGWCCYHVLVAYYPPEDHLFSQRETQQKITSYTSQLCGVVYAGRYSIVSSKNIGSVKRKVILASILINDYPCIEEHQGTTSLQSGFDLLQYCIINAYIQIKKKKINKNSVTQESWV